MSYYAITEHMGSKQLADLERLIRRRPGGTSTEAKSVGTGRLMAAMGLAGRSPARRPEPAEETQE